MEYENDKATMAISQTKRPSYCLASIKISVFTQGSWKHVLYADVYMALFIIAKTWKYN